MKGNLVFTVTCVVLALIALGQVLIASLAIAARLEQAGKPQIVERTVEKVVHVPVEVAASDRSSRPLQARSIAFETKSVKPQPLELPKVQDPRSERLLGEAREARIAGDMGMAIVKLEEALKASPKDPSLLYEMGLIHETMGVFDRASSYYERVFQLGVTGAGSLYQLAASKLETGFQRPAQMVGKIALGRVKMYQEPRTSQGQKVVISVPVEKAPEAKVEQADIEAEVIFFNKTSKGEIVRLEDAAWATAGWATAPVNWEEGAESFRVIYRIPAQDNKTRHLFGDLEYYGQVVTLSYQGEIVDVQAWPRGLAAKMSHLPEADDGFTELPDFLNGGLLPHKKHTPNSSSEILPTR